MDLGRACKLTKSRRRKGKKWRLDKFYVEGTRSNYQRALELKIDYEGAKNEQVVEGPCLSD